MVCVRRVSTWRNPITCTWQAKWEWLMSDLKTLFRKWVAPCWPVDIDEDTNLRFWCCECASGNFLHSGIGCVFFPVFACILLSICISGACFALFHCVLLCTGGQHRCNCSMVGCNLTIVGSCLLNRLQVMTPGPFLHLSLTSQILIYWPDVYIINE